MSKWDPRLSLVRSPNEGGLNDRSCAVNWINEAMQLAHQDKWCFAGFWISRSIKTRGYSMSPLDFITLTLADLSITMLIKAGAYHSSSCDGSNNFSTGFEGKKRISQSVLEAEKLVLMRLTIFLDFFQPSVMGTFRLDQGKSRWFSGWGPFVHGLDSTINERVDCNMRLLEFLAVEISLKGLQDRMNLGSECSIFDETKGRGIGGGGQGCRRAV